MLSRPLALVLLTLGAVACHDATTAPPKTARVVLLGDSNTDLGFDSAGVVQEASYISPDAHRLPATAANGPHQLAGKLNALNPNLVVVNHGIAYSGTGEGYNWAPGARYNSHGITRFAAEVLGVGRPTWDGDTGIPRVQAFRPSAADFVYISLGTDDRAIYQIPADSTIADLAWMIDQWTQAGLPASHILLTTLPPIDYVSMQALDDQIRTLASARGVQLIDLAAYTSEDDGGTWRNRTITLDGVHYAEPVRAWLATQIARAIDATS